MSLIYAADTNVLLRLSDNLNSQHSLIAEAVRRLRIRNIQLSYTAQNLGEFWNVSTRPAGRNGFGLSIQETSRRFRSIQQNMILLPDVEDVFHVWLGLLESHQVQGVEVHDAHLAAVVKVHGIQHLLTFNGQDFKRFPHIIPVHPRDIS